MRIKTIEKEIYKYSELSESAKEVAKQWYLDGQESEIFSDMCNESLGYKFPNSDLEVQYSLNYCQGDGLNIYGKINFNDLLNSINDNFTEEEQNELKKYFNSLDEYKLEENTRYTYCIIDRQNILEDLIAILEDEEVTYNEELLQKFRRVSVSYLYKLCKDMEENGYDYFYEISEEDMKEMCEVNEYEFDIDGNIV